MKTEELNQTITSFKETPLYLAKIETSAIGFDIRINDLPVLQFNEEGGGTQIELPINQAILSSGKQKLTVRVFPLSGKDEISADAEFKITLKQVDKEDFGGERETVLPEITMENADHEGSEWKIEKEFEAEVPYELEGWTNGRNLREVDDLQDKLEAAYQEILQAIEEKDGERFVEFMQEKIEQEALSNYEELEDMEGFLGEETALPLTDCHLEFYGDDKLVRLETSEKESCLKTKTDEWGEEEVITYPIFFYWPKNGEGLKVIR